MKATQITEDYLLENGWDDTMMRLGKNQIWQNATYRIIYDPNEKRILCTFMREFKYLFSNKTGGSLSVGERSHN